MPSVSKTCTVAQTSSEQPLTAQDTHQTAPPIPSNCMKGSVKKTRTRTRRRNRGRRSQTRSSKDKKKMLPARVARLLGSKPGVVKLGKRVFCSTGDGQIGVLARGHGKVVDIGSVCNLKTGSDNRTFSTLSSCQETCGTFLCVGKDKENPSALLSQSLLSRDSKALISTDSSEGQSTLATSTQARTDRFVAMDCEMVGVGEQGSRNALGRCSIVSYEGDVLYDKYVKPDRPIVDYRTPWSGIVAEHMETAIPFYQAKKEAAEILKDKIIIGHDLRNDFSVLEMSHPEHDVRDTSRYRGLRYLGGVDEKKRSVGLKMMVERLFGRKIQTGPHCSVEDARAAMSLYRLVDGQWEEDAISLYPERQFRAGF